MVAVQGFECAIVLKHSLLACIFSFIQGWREAMGIYEREKLYEEVWKEPVLVVANRYGVSGVALAKACRKLAVPLPPRGYWARVRAGRRAPPRPPLPPYESPSRIQTTRPVPGKSAGAAASKVTDEKPGHGPQFPPSRDLRRPIAPPARKGKRKIRSGIRGRPRRRKFRNTFIAPSTAGSERFASASTVSARSKDSRKRKMRIDEWDHLQVFATVRYHHKPLKGRKRTGQHVELWLSPTHVPRTDWRDDPEAIGGVWTEQGRLFGTVYIPADTFYSLFPCLASNHFKELVLRLIRMHYRQGDIDGIEFSPKETPMEDLAE